MPSIAVRCHKCGGTRNVPDSEVCLGVRCQKCELFMEAERKVDLDELDYTFTGRRRVRQLTPLAKIWLLLMIIASITIVPILYLTGHLEAAAESPLVLRSVLIAGVMSLLNVVFSISVLYLKKNGFYALAGVAVVAAGFLLIGAMIHATARLWGLAVAELVAVGILFAALQAGDPDSWSQLR